MDIDLSPEQIDFVRLAIESGRVRDTGQAVQEAMTLWVERERRRANLLASLDAADVSLSRGEGFALAVDSVRSIATDVLERNRHRFSVTPPASR